MARMEVLTGKFFCRGKAVPTSWLALAENRQNVPSAVKDPDYLQRVGLGILHDDVIRIGLDCPEAKRKFS